MENVNGVMCESMCMYKASSTQTIIKHPVRKLAQWTVECYANDHKQYMSYRELEITMTSLHLLACSIPILFCEYVTSL